MIPHRRRLSMPIVLILGAVAVITAAVGIDSHYEHRASQALETRRLLLTTDVVLHDLAALEWEAIARSDSAAVAEHAEEVARDLRTRTADLMARDPALERFADAVDRYVALVESELELIEQGRAAELEAVRHQIHDVFEDLEAAEDTTFVVLLDRASRSSSLARTVSRLSLVVVTCVAALAMFRLQGARQVRKSIADKDRFLATVSHELRTPLTALVGVTSVLQEGWREYEPEEVARLIHDLGTEAMEMSMLIEDLLVVARAEIGSVSVRPDIVEMRECVVQALKTVSVGDPERIDLVSGEVVALADPLRVRQIIRNLVTNALRYGGPRIRIECVAVESFAAVSVVDNGMGIPLTDRDRIFEPYRRGSQGGDAAGSVGLGLAVSRDLARRMGGDLRYRFADGESIFTLLLPFPAMSLTNTGPACPEGSL